jgi:hypothetical protein
MRELREAVERESEGGQAGRKEGRGVVGFGLGLDLISGHFSAAGEHECKVTVTGKHESKDWDASQSMLIRII